MSAIIPFLGNLLAFTFESLYLSLKPAIALPVKVTDVIPGEGESTNS